MVKKILKIIGGLLLLIVLAVALFVNLSPQFGGSHTKEALERFQTSENYKDGKFQNQVPTRTTPSWRDIPAVFDAITQDVVGGAPSKNIEVLDVPEETFKQVKKSARFVWFGHSAILLEIGGKRLFLDPMLSDVPAPHPLLGDKRFSNKLPMTIEELPVIDAVILSHDHYDHLDYESIKKLKDKVKKYYVPLGLGSHLLAWGIDAGDIIELDWWEETTLDNIKLAAAPSRHFSGRRLTDSKETQWSSWIISAGDERVYFSGDSGYGPHFKKIGEKYGPFSLAYMECGQYNDNLPQFPIHMFPEETVQASIDLQAKRVMPIHWGAFKLNQHAWKEPVERFTYKAKNTELELLIPQIGEVCKIVDENYTNSDWWKNIH